MTPIVAMTGTVIGTKNKRLRGTAVHMSNKVKYWTSYGRVNLVPQLGQAMQLHLEMRHRLHGTNRCWQLGHGRLNASNMTSNNSVERPATTVFRTGPRIQCHGAHGAAPICHGPFQWFVRRHKRVRCSTNIAATAPDNDNTTAPGMTAKSQPQCVRFARHVAQVARQSANAHRIGRKTIDATTHVCNGPGVRAFAIMNP
jgi:hypothetical protein